MTPDALVEADVEVERRNLTVGARLSVDAGERLALFGPSGAGKSTLVEAVAGLVRLRRGSIRIGGDLVAGAQGPGGGGRRVAVLPPARRGIGLVRQPVSLFPHLTVEQNVAYGVRAPRRGDVLRLIEQLGLTDLRLARPAALSGGQRQRAALGRALATGFRLLLLDEPLSAIDGAARADLRDLAVGVAAEREAAAVLVSHDLPEAQAFATALGVVDGGRLLQLGDPQTVVRRPASQRVATLVGYCGFVPRGPGGSFFAIHPDRVLLGGMPERGVVLSGRLEWSRPHGARHECRVLLAGGERLDVRLEDAPAAGSDVTVTALDPPSVPA